MIDIYLRREEECDGRLLGSYPIEELTQRLQEIQTILGFNAYDAAENNDIGNISIQTVVTEYDRSKPLFVEVIITPKDD